LGLNVLVLTLSTALFAETLSSPDGRLSITFDTAEEGQLVYEVSYQGKPVIVPSKLGLALGNYPVLGAGVKVDSAQPSSHDETYETIHGKSKPVRDHYNALRLELVESGFGGHRFAMEARAYDDGVAFRYALPDPLGRSKDFRLREELTEFRLAKDCTTYPIIIDGWANNYEDNPVQLPVSGVLPSFLVGVPFLANLHGTAWVAITEAHLEDYAGMYLRRIPEAHGFRVDLPAKMDESDLKVRAGLPHQTPWRVILVASEVGRFIESNTILNLNPPSAIADTSWIKPGKASWNWWFGRVQTDAGFEARMDTQTMKHLIDFSSESGLEYLLIDAGWSARNDITKYNDRVDMPEILRYAKEKGVGVWVWLYWTAVDGMMEEAFPLYEQWGIKGVKIDFMDRDDQWMVDWYHRVIELAAKHHIMVNMHGAYKPTGIRRTWPNLMTREGILGQEYSKWSFAVDAEHNVILPFTRLLAGPGDFTPGGFDNVTRDQFEARNNDPMVMGTRAHNMAMFVVYDSPLMVLCDHPSAYKGQPEFQFIKDTPATWDETRVINAEVGDFITVARRSGNDWFVGSMNDWTVRELNIPMSFLGPGKYTAKIYADAPDASENPKHVDITEMPVDRSTVIKVSVASGGGHCIRIRPLQ
jgi:alpha-glucosidase